MAKKIAIAIAVVFVAIQLVPYGRNHTNPAADSQPKWDSPQTKETFFRVCADCHSNKTKWPWYSHIAPASWLIQKDVSEGREAFNATMWGINKENEGEHAAEEVKEGAMPLWFYLPLHPKARLSASEKEAFAKGLEATFKSDGENEGSHKSDHHEHHHHDEDHD